MTDDEIRVLRARAAGRPLDDYGFNGDVVALADEALRRREVWVVTHTMCDYGGDTDRFVAACASAESASRRAEKEADRQIELFKRAAPGWSFEKRILMPDKQADPRARGIEVGDYEWWVEPKVVVE